MNQEQLRGALENELNEHLEAEVKVGDIRMDFFSRFPDVSFRFNEVFCREVIPATSSDTLFYFKAVYFEFNIWQLIRSEYELRGISFDQGNVEIRMYADGTDNFHFWKETTDTAQSSLRLGLEDVRFNETTIRFEDRKAEVITFLVAESLDLKGDVAGSNFSSTLKWRGEVRSLISEEIEWLSRRKVFAEIDFRTSGDTTAIENGLVEVEGLRMSANGLITGGEQQWTFNGEQLLISDFIELLPASFIPDKSLVDAGGSFSLALKLELRNDVVLIAADTRMENGEIRLKRSGLNLSQLEFDGHFDNGVRGRMEDAALRIERIKAGTRTGVLNAELSIRNFISPTVATSGNIDMDFDEALGLANTNFWEEASGRLKGSFNIRKRYTNFDEIQNTGLEGAYLKGQMTLTEGRLKVKDTGLDMQNLGAALSLEGADVNLENLSFSSGESDFKASGSIRNAVVFGSRTVPFFHLNLSARQLDLADIFAWELNHRKSPETDDEPFRFDFNVNLSVAEFRHKTFTASNVTGRFISDGRDIVGSDIRFQAVGGQAESQFRWHPDGPVNQLVTRGKLRNVDIHRLFTEFENFGQSSLTAENIYGKADVDYAVSIYFDESMSPVLSSLVSESDFKIKEGRLVNYTPLEKLSRFADVSELRDVHFATLENHLSIADQNIHIPGMNVKSSVLELWVEGDHGFDDRIDYSLKLQLSDALGSRRRTSSELSDFIEESDREQPLIPVRIYGPLDNLSISLDRSLLNRGLRDEWQSQGDELRDLLEGKEDPASEEPTYIFEWNDERDTTGR